MNLNIKTNGFDLTPSVRDYIEKKIGALEKFVLDEHKSALKIDIEVGRSTFHHKKGDVYEAKAHLTMPKIDIYAAEESEDIFSAIDLIEAKIKNELLKTKAKKRDLLRRSLRQFKKILRLPKFWRKD